MTPERHQQIKRLFLAALELAPDEIGPFLDHACPGDGDLQSEVQSLIANHRTQTLLSAQQALDTAAPRPTTLLSALESQFPPVTACPPPPPRPAGTMIAGRYRLQTPLGRGGMGAVYRADDIELDQTIALKFLNPLLEERPEAIDLLRREVRIARQITHPNVVRIFDLGTAGSETFISMEFVAGEDLQSLVRRVGPLPPAKVQQIARQMAAALAAAHEVGVLHRDLKPANVMIDGSGNVRLLDFGIAAPLNDDEALRRLSGTPGFLAPELLVGEKPSPQSDLFAWGIAVYFAATGKLPALDGPRPNDAIADDLSTLSSDLAACVTSCLQPDPARRPASARSLLATLGDPLDEAIRAGQIPSLDLVAAATGWNPSASLLNGLLAAGIALLVLIVLLADRTLFLPRCGLVKSPQALQQIAEQLLVDLGHPAPTSPVLSGAALDTDCLQFVRAHPEHQNAWRQITAAEIPAVRFWYRRGDSRLPRPSLEDETDEPPDQPISGAVFVQLDGRGKLLSLQAATAFTDHSPSEKPIDWPRLLELAGLHSSEFHDAPIDRWPPLFADEVHCWQGPTALDPAQQVTVVAAALRGRVVYFDVQQPWQLARPATARPIGGAQSSRYFAVRTALWLVAMAAAAFLAWLHVEQGHADFRGAWRIAIAVLVLGLLDWLCGSRHNFLLGEEISAAFDWLIAIVFFSTVSGVAYLAVEPAGRRWWPWALITIRRLLDGRLRDRAIWADELLGIVAGLGCVALRQLGTLTNQLFAISVSGLNDFDPSQNLLDHFGLRYKVAVLVSALLLAVIDSLLMLALIAALRRVTRSTLLAAILVVVTLTALAIAGRGIISPIDWLSRGLLMTIAVALLLRYGLLTTITALATFYAINNAPITLDPSRWYASTGLLVVAAAAIMLLLSWRLAREAIPLPSGGSRP